MLEARRSATMRVLWNICQAGDTAIESKTFDGRIARHPGNINEKDREFTVFPEECNPHSAHFMPRRLKKNKSPVEKEILALTISIGIKKTPTIDYDLALENIAEYIIWLIAQKPRRLLCQG